MTVHKHILLPLPFAHGFDYRVPEHMEVRAGDYVRVPFGRKSLWGVVWGEAEGGVEEKKIKEIEAIAATIPLRRLAQPEEIARTAYFLCSDENTYIAGQEIVADGGFLCQ